jgi:hypothetical protein
MSASSALRSVLPIGVLLTCLAIGVWRRRHSWSRGGWLRFALLFGCCLGAVALALWMAASVDAGIYERMPIAAHRPYLVAMMLFLVGGTLGAVAAAWWLAFGRRERELGGPRPVSQRDIG